MEYLNFDKIDVYKKLAEHIKAGFDFKAKLDAKRVGQCLVPMAASLTFSWAAKSVDDKCLSLLKQLADEQQLINKYKALLDGEVMNTGEKRKVLHHLSRGELGQPVIEDGKNIGEFYRKELDRFCTFATAVHDGKFKGSTGKPFTTVIQIGIGGSDLGPRAMYLALENWAEVMQNLITAKRAPKATKASYLLKANTKSELANLQLRAILELGLANETNVLKTMARMREARRMIGGWLKSTP